MRSSLAYLDWAIQHYPGLRCDLASSGTREVRASELSAVARADDHGAEARFARAVADRYGVPHADVLPVLGASGGLFTLFYGLFDAGDEVLIEQPAYEPVVRVAASRGLSVRRFARDQRSGYVIDPDAIVASLSARTRAVVVTDLHNPSGVAANHDALRALAAALDARSAWLVVDEVYAELVAPRRTARVLGPNVITTSSLTKAFGLGWMRAGFVLAPAPLVAQMSTVARHTAGVLPPASFAWGEVGMAEADALIARRDARTARNRPLVDAFVARHAPTLSWTPPEPRSLFGFVHDARGRDLRATLERGAREHGVLAAAGVFFDAPSGFRLGWTTEPDVLADGLALLARALDL